MIGPEDIEAEEDDEYTTYLDGDDCVHDDGPEGGSSEYSWSENGC